MKLAETEHDGKRRVEVSAVIAYGGKKMKVVILAGGLGTRISEESHLKPKPMIEIGGRPILWHIMKYYSEFGFHDFVICLGYKQYVVNLHLVVGQVKGHIGGMQEIICKELLHNILLISKTDHKIMESELGIIFHNVPQNRASANLDHWLRL